jgi:hypothetical protein
VRDTLIKPEASSPNKNKFETNLEHSQKKELLFFKSNFTEEHSFSHQRRALLAKKVLKPIRPGFLLQTKVYLLWRSASA